MGNREARLWASEYEPAIPCRTVLSCGLTFVAFQPPTKPLPAHDSSLRPLLGALGWKQTDITLVLIRTFVVMTSPIVAQNMTKRPLRVKRGVSCPAPLPRPGRWLSVGTRFPACRSICRRPIPHGWPQVPRRDHTPSLVQLIRSALSAAIAHPTDAFTRLASSLKSPHDMRVLRPQATARLSVVRLRLATRRQKNTAGYQPPQATT